MNAEIKSYVNSFIPQTLSKTKKKELYDELMCHLLDKADRYEEIGYSKEDSMKKAIDDFGTDETVKDSVSTEFENLYHEKTWWALIPAAIILLMNASCILFGNWTYSADLGSDPNPIQAFISFIMIFVCIGLIFFLRVKRYRKMLVGAAIGNLLVSASLIMVLYPQSALFAIENNIYLLIDKLTPFVAPKEPLWVMTAAHGFLILSAVYCVIAAILIKKDRARKIKNPRKKAIVLGVCYSAVALISCILLPKALDYNHSYPNWFRVPFATEESEKLYDMLDLYMPYSEAAEKLSAEGWIEISDYEKSLDKNEQKKFRAEYNKELNYSEEYKVFFCSKRYISGNGFVFLKADSAGSVIFKGIGDLNQLEPEEYDYYSSGNGKDNNQALPSDFKSLKKGDSRLSVMDLFDKYYVRVRSHFESVTDGKHIERFVLDVRDEREFEDYLDSEVELTFSDGMLTWGRMLKTEWDGAAYIHTEITID